MPRLQPPSPFHRRAQRSLLVALGFLLTVTELVAQLPPPPPTNAVRRVLGTAKPPLVFTNLEISWDRYTNAYFEIVGQTNLANTNWYHFTNAPLWTTNLVLPMRYPSEFFRVQTVLTSP